MPIVSSFQVEVREEEIFRLLSRKPGRGAPAGDTVELVRAMMKEAGELAEPRGVYEFVDRSALGASPVFRSARRVAFCVCTIGRGLETRVRQLMEAGEPVRGVVLDAVGSEMAEATARYLDDRIAEAADSAGLGAGGRFSPGYGGWELGAQRMIFALLSPETIGVTLSGSLMMVPRKSVSFAVNLGPGAEPPRCATACRVCEMEDCPFRREDGSGC